MALFITSQPQFTSECSSFMEAKSKCIRNQTVTKNNYYFDQKDLERIYLKTEQQLTNYTELINSYPKNSKKVKSETSMDRKSKRNIKEQQVTSIQFKHLLYLTAKRFGIKQTKLKLNTQKENFSFQMATDGPHRRRDGVLFSAHQFSVYKHMKL